VLLNAFRISTRKAVRSSEIPQQEPKGFDESTPRRGRATLEAEVESRRVRRLSAELSVKAFSLLSAPHGRPGALDPN
jgi:hypothetical protein